MIIVHAIIGAAGWAVMLLASIGLVVSAAAVTVSVRSRNHRSVSKPAAAPVWWDQLG
jgi:hypothetical protein